MRERTFWRLFDFVVVPLFAFILSPHHFELRNILVTYLVCTFAYTLTRHTERHFEQ